MIRPVSSEDAAQIAAIYNHYVEHTVITFEETLVSAAEMGGRIETIATSYPYLVATDGDVVLGYAYATRWGTRRSYRLSVETSVYVAQERLRQGYGEQLYVALLARLKQRRFHCALGGIALPNDASVRLHEKLGFKKVGRFEEVGRKFERWIDVGYWELLL